VAGSPLAEFSIHAVPREPQNGTKGKVSRSEKKEGGPKPALLEVKSDV